MANTHIACATHTVRALATHLALHPTLPNASELDIALFKRVAAIIHRTENAPADATIVFGASHTILAIFVVVTLVFMTQNTNAARVTDIAVGAKPIAGLALAGSVRAPIGIAIRAFLVAVAVKNTLCLADTSA
jgi:hypothetical protein